MKTNKESIFINIGFVLIPTLLMYIGIIGIIDLNRYQKESEWLSTTYKIIETNTLLLSNLKDAETGQRGYIISGDSSFLEPYLGTKERNAELVSILKELTANDDTQKENIDSIATLSNLRLTILDYTMHVKLVEGTEASSLLLSKGRGKGVMDQVRFLCNNLNEYENLLLQQHQKNIAKTSSKTRILFFTSVSFTVLIVVLIFLLLKVEIGKREKIEKELLISREWYAGTLTSLGEGVITTDTKHKITFMNKAAEELTQWSYTEAVGRPISVVFNIINEVTRKPMEPTSIKAIEEEKYIALGTRTLLIRKDGYEYNIDDSAAPLLDNEGNTIGSVLIFKNITEQTNAKKQFQNKNIHLDEIVKSRIKKLEEEERNPEKFQK